MTRCQTSMPFHNLVFHACLPDLRDVAKRLMHFQKTTREKPQRVRNEARRMKDSFVLTRHNLKRQPQL